MLIAQRWYCQYTIGNNRDSESQCVANGASLLFGIRHTYDSLKCIHHQLLQAKRERVFNALGPVAVAGIILINITLINNCWNNARPITISREINSLVNRRDFSFLFLLQYIQFHTFVFILSFIACAILDHLRITLFHGRLVCRWSCCCKLHLLSLRYVPAYDGSLKIENWRCDDSLLLHTQMMILTDTVTQKHFDYNDCEY